MVTLAARPKDVWRGMCCHAAAVETDPAAAPLYRATGGMNPIPSPTFFPAVPGS